MRPAGRPVRSTAFDPFSCLLGVVGCVRSIPMCSRGRRVRSGAFGPFPYALGVVYGSSGSVHSRSPWGLFGCFRPIPMRPGGRTVRRYIPVRPSGRRVRLGAFAPFPYALGVVSVRLFHSRVPWGS